MFDILAKILNVKELRVKLGITFLLLIVFRLGSFIPTPGVNVKAITDYVASAQGTVGAVLSMADMFTGGALSLMAIFGLGIMPYITASIIFQLLTAIIPSLSRLAHEGATGRKKINQYVRASTVLLCLVQASMLAWGMINASSGGSVSYIADGVSGWEFFLYVVLSLTVGTMFLMWLGEQIDEFGIGSGISLIIMSGILSRIPSAIARLISGANPAAGGGSVTLLDVVILLVLFVAMTLAVVMITLGTRRVPIMQAKAVRGRKTYGGQRQFLPLKVNQANVIPIIFGQAIMQVVAGFAGMISSYGVFMSPGSFWYTVCYVLLIIFFCYFYTAIQFNPNEMADNLKQGGMYIPGIRPGKRTAEHLGKIMNRIALAGGVFLAIIAVVPQFISQSMNVGYDISGLMGGTGLLIVVGVALDVVQKVESYLLMRNYEGFGIAGGRIKGRR